MNKVVYTDDVTVIEAQNLNDIQDTIIRIDPADDTGKSIPQNADLDTYTTPGLYFCPNSTTAATLINSPGLSAGFSLVVLAKSTLYQTQLINSGGYLYFRQRSSNGWSSWYSTALLEINNTFKGVVRVQQANSDTSNTQSLVSVGNNIPEGTVGATYGCLQLYGSNDKYVFLRTPSTALGANRTIYLPDANGTIALKTTLTDISSNCTYGRSDGTGKIRVLYDPMNKIVRGSFSIYNATAFNTSAIMWTIPSGYRPSAAVQIPMMVQSSGGWLGFYGYISTAGAITQSATNIASGAYGTFEYQVS